MSFAPRFSPDGQRVIMSLQQGGNSNLFVMDLRSKSTTRLTDTPAIDTSPSYSPDGSRICFESDRGGKPQIYVMAATGGPAQRISFSKDDTNGSYSTPVWSPRGDYIAFTKQGGGQFSIGIMKPDGSGERILTSGFHNEGPTFAPERPGVDVLPRSRRQQRTFAVHRRHLRTQRTEGADPRLRVRPGVVAAVVVAPVYQGAFADRVRASAQEAEAAISVRRSRGAIMQQSAEIAVSHVRDSRIGIPRHHSR